ncbi:lipopolysaccharide/colanic/teichoic acid biosynthesis glycosyltransferase [Flavobacterium sp. 1]|uniref:sugar transferase n=1 Tax=Flavobacterium sp. 1 TaxID=2035200 RepID=UPI000C247C57|nr:sugar transferase [Flavobacterium sp. 1]PJJ10945.1 lipopolysaccharide/colanic/teichoic acid biosynthesis glycosyltransferase [Flavobacterium sp. 1]
MQPTIKRFFDILFAALALIFFFWLLVPAWFIAIIDTRTNGIFTQVRIGQYGKRFKIYKLRTMQVDQNLEGLQVSRLGQLLRNFKLDELPQLINVLRGEMSIVGPRPDVEGYYDLLEGENRKILELKPGLTCLASLKYYDEYALLNEQSNPLGYNDNVVFPDKVKMNLEYYEHQSFFSDLKIIVATSKFIFKRINFRH